MSLLTAAVRPNVFVDPVWDATAEAAEAAVRIAIRNGVILHAGPFTVGRYRAAGDGDWPERWAVLQHPGDDDDLITDDAWLASEVFVGRVGITGAMNAAAIRLAKML